MGILPNKVDGITPGLLFTVTDPANSGYDLSDPDTFGGLTERLGWRDQVNVTEYLKAIIKQSSAWNQSTEDVWGSLRRGAELPLAIIEAIIQHILPFGLGNFIDLDAALDTVEEAFENLFAFFGSINPLSPDFSIEDAATAFINLILIPTNLIVGLIDGLLSADIIPGLDASKIISGVFSIGQIGDLQDTLDLLQDGIDNIPGGQALIDKICNALGVSGTGHTVTDAYNALMNIPGPNIGSAIAAAVVPGIDASKIITGTIAQSFLSITNIAAGIISGTLSGANIPSLDASKVTTGTFGTGLIPGLDAAKIISGIFGGGLIPSLDASKITSGTFGDSLLPDIAPTKSVAMQGIIDSLINAAKNTSATGQGWTNILNAWAPLPTQIWNKLGGNNDSKASVDDATAAMAQLVDTIGKQGQAITNLQNILEGAAGFSATVTFRQPETVVITQPSNGIAQAINQALPSWFVPNTDWLDAIWVAPGAGGDGYGGLGQSNGTDGNNSTVVVNGTTYTALGGTASISGNKIGLQSGDQTYQDILYPGGAAQATDAADGNTPGGGGASGFSGANDRRGGGAGAWQTLSVKPTSAANITGNIGARGAGGAAGAFFGGPGGNGGLGRTWLRFRPAMPSSFTSMGNIATLSGGGGGLVIPLYRLNTGVALTDAMTAAASWVRNPPSPSTGGHVLIIRAHSSFSHYVYLRVWYTGGNTNYEIGRVVSSTRAVWKSATIAGAIPFNAFSLSSDTTRIFTVAINGIPFDSYSDVVAASSAMGPAYMSGGWGSSDAALPGSIQQFAFLDSGTPSRITSNTVAASQTSTSTTYANLATVGPSVTVTVPPSGEVMVDFSADASIGGTGVQQCYIAVEMSGSNTVAAADTNAAWVRLALSGTLGATVSGHIHFTGLTPGATTFTIKYKTSVGTATFANRRIIVDPRP